MGMCSCELHECCILRYLSALFAFRPSKKRASVSLSPTLSHSLVRARGSNPPKFAKELRKGPIRKGIRLALSLAQDLTPLILH